MAKPQTDSALSNSSIAGDRRSASITQILAILFAEAVVVLIFIGAAYRFLPAFNFRYNGYAWFSFVAIISNLVLLILISRVKAKTGDLVWLSLYITCLIMWSVVELLTRLSATKETFLFWWPLSAPPVFFVPVMLFMFVLSYTKPAQSRHIWTIVSLFVTALVLIFFDLRTPMMNHYIASEMISTPWNGAVLPGPYFDVIAIWILGLTSLSLAMLIQFYRHTLQPVLKRQAKLFIAALLIPVVIGSVTDALLPAMGNFRVLPLATLLTAVSGGIITYGMLRYRFLTLNPALVATNILETINEAVIGVKVDLGVTYANKGAERLLGYSAHQFAKLRFTDFLSQKWDVDTLKKGLFGTTGDRKHAKMDSIDLRTAKGDIVTAKLSVTGASEDGDKEEGYLVVLTDISEMDHARQIIEQTVEARTREVQEAKATLVASINSLKLGFIITDAKAEVTRVNTVAHDLFCPNFRNHPAGECREVTMAMVQKLLENDFSLVADIARCLKRQLPHEVKNVVFDDRSWRLYLSPMVVNRVSIGCAVLFQDTTQERLLERSRDEFFSIASHELRTPLTSIKGNSSLILQFYKKILKDETLNEMVTDIHDSSDRLIEIVNDFLDVSRLEQGRIEFHLEKLQVSKVIEDVVYGMGALIKQKKLKVHLSHNIRQIDALPEVVVDKNRLKQVFFNLLGNAVKFTSKGSISVDAEVVRDMIKLTFTDTGTGISTESQTLLFRKFQQASDSILTRDSTNGTGLGLYISRLLASGMGGELGLQSSVPGKGSVFFVLVPVATPARIKHMNETVLAPDSRTGLLVEELHK